MRVYALLLILSLAGCSQFHPGAASRPPEPDAAFQVIADDYIIAILNQTPAIMAAAHANLEDSLPRPQIETAIEEADGTADFLGKDLVDALKVVKDDKLMADFNAANQRAIQGMRGYSTWLKEQ